MKMEIKVNLCALSVTHKESHVPYSRILCYKNLGLAPGTKSSLI